MDVRAVKLVPRAQRHLPRPARVSEHTILVLDNFDMDVAQYSVTAPSAFTLRIYSYAIRVLKTNSEFLLRHAAVYDPRLPRQLVRCVVAAAASVTDSATRLAVLAQTGVAKAKVAATQAHGLPALAQARAQAAD